MDLFGRRRISELERQLELATGTIESLKSDVLTLERINYELITKYEPNRGPHIVKYASTAYAMPLGGTESQQQASSHISTSPTEYTDASVCQSISSVGIVTGALLGAAVASSLSDNSTLDSNSASPDCSSD